MSTTKETVRVNRKTLEKLKRAANWALGEEMKLARDAVSIARDRDSRGRWIAAQGRSALSLKGETGEEVQAIQNRSAIRSAGVGALLAFVANTEFVKNVQAFKDHWWLLPLAVLALGWFLKNRGYKDAPAILTFGGVMLVQAYQKHKDEEEAKKPAANSAASPNTAGFFDTGAIHTTGGNYAWLQDPFGRWMKLTMPAATAAMLAGYAGQPRALPAANMNTAGPSQEDYEAAQQLAAATFAHDRL